VKSIAFINRKGGCGKTSTCHHLAGTLVRRGLRVLLVDLDPQASLTQGLLGTTATLALHPAETIAGLFGKSGMSMAEIVKPVGVAGLGLVPGHDDLYRFNHPEPWLRGEEQFLLRDGLAELTGMYDIALIDGPPHIQLAGWNALVGADGIVVPTPLEDYGIHGVAAVLDSIDHARHLANPNLRLLGLLPTMYTKTLKIHLEYEKNLRAAFAADVFDAVIPLAKDFKEAVTAGKSIVEYKPRSAAAKAIDVVLDELLTRLADRCGVAFEADVAERIGA
jgi:chromosome partitioning protein